MVDELDELAITTALGPRRLLGSPVRCHPVAVNVEALALQWARQEDAPEGALVVVDLELAGRGRRGVPWRSVPGGQLAAAVVLRPEAPPEAEGVLWLIGCLALTDALAALGDLAPCVEWPNDVLVRGRRLGLIKVVAGLAPGRIEFAVVSFRVNLALPVEVRRALGEEVTDLRRCGVSTVRRWELLRGILDGLEGRYDQPVVTLLDEYSRRCATLGRRVRARLMPTGEVVGRAERITALGGLVIATPGGEMELAIDQVARLETA